MHYNRYVIYHKKNEKDYDRYELRVKARNHKEALDLGVKHFKTHHIVIEKDFDER